MPEQKLNKQHIVCISIGLVILVLVAFEPLRHNDFIDYDDNDYITTNPYIQNGLNWQSIRWAFTACYAANWHPLTWLSHMVDIELFGLKPLGHHLHSLLLHTVSTVLLFRLLYQMTSFLWPSAFVAMIFGIHPLRVESVAWAAERKDVLSMFFFILTLAAYFYYVKRGGIGRYLLVILCFALGLMTKPMLVTLPLVLLLLDFWPLGRIHYNNKNCGTLPLNKLIIEKTPLFFLTILSCIITYHAQQQSMSIATTEQFPILFRVLNAGLTTITYIGKTVWPQHLAILYPFPEKGFRIVPLIGAFTGLLVVFIYVFSQFLHRPYLFIGWMWYIITLIPVIGLVHVGSQRMADRYTYLPSIGLYLITAWAAARLSHTWRHRAIILGIVCLVIMAALISTTRKQLSYWKNSIALYEHALTVTPGNYIIESNLGMALLSENHIEQAREHLVNVLAIHPTDPYANINMALISKEKKQPEQILNYLHKALASPENNVTSYFRIGTLFQMEGQPDDAIAAYEKIIAIAPDDHIQTLNNLGVLKHQKGLPDEASAYLRRAVESAPTYTDAHCNFARVLQAQGHLKEAIEHYLIVLKTEPEDYTVSFAIALLSAQTGNLHDAVVFYRKTLQLKSDYAPAMNDLAWLLAATPDNEIRNPAEALTLAQKACQLTEFNDALQLDTLAVAYAAAGQFKEAVETAQKAANIANTANQADLATRIEKRRQLYQNQKPYYDSFPTN